MKASTITAAAAGILIGGVVFSANNAKAILGAGDVVTDPGSYEAIATLQTALTQVISKMQDSLINKFTDIGNLLDDKLTAGFTQNANYAKASVGAQQQIAAASNTVNAAYQRSIRNAQLRDEHTLSPQACLAVNDGQSVAVAAGQAWRVSQAINAVTDRRGQALPGTPANAGQGQAAAAITQLHLARYCDENEAASGLCAVTPGRQNLDQSAASLLGVSAYNSDPANSGVDAANDFATNLVQPIVPAASRGDGLNSVAGQDAQTRRRGYNAKMSLAHAVANDVIASRANSVDLTAAQKQEQADEGLTQTDQSSWLGALELDVNRRASGVAWAASLQADPPKSVLIEIATALAQSNTIALATFKLAQQNAMVNAALLAGAAEAGLKPDPTMPSPNMASH